MVRITFIKVRRVPKSNINEELQWLGSSLGLFNLRDKDSSCFRIFITLVKVARKNESLTSDEIAERLKLTRGTVVHHLNKLMDACIVIKDKNGYLLRETNLHKLVDDLEQDLERMLSELKNVAKEIDESMG